MKGYVKPKGLKAGTLPEMSLNNSKLWHGYSQNEYNRCVQPVSCGRIMIVLTMSSPIAMYKTAFMSDKW